MRSRASTAVQNLLLQPRSAEAPHNAVDEGCFFWSTDCLQLDKPIHEPVQAEPIGNQIAAMDWYEPYGRAVVPPLARCPIKFQLYEVVITAGITCEAGQRLGFLQCAPTQQRSSGFAENSQLPSSDDSRRVLSSSAVVPRAEA